jgi:protein phosphatase 1 regulatory subunit 42
MEKNMITKLDGLDNCRKLEELYLGNQVTPQGVEFTFDEYSLAAVSNSLKLLDLPSVNLVNPKPLYYLEGLDSINLKDNAIVDLENEICPLLQTMNYLRILKLNNNPVTGVQKYRDQIVLLSRSVQELDGKDITDSERKYLVNLINKKKVQGNIYVDMKKKKELLKLKIEGTTQAIHTQKA